MHFPPSALGLGLLAALVATSATAAEPPVPAYPSPPRPVSLVSEIRLGGSVHEIGGNKEESGAIVGEVLSPKLFTTADLFTSYFVPRVHVGGSMNLGHKTSFAYAGLTWTVDITPNWFVEGTFGGAIHDGHTGPGVDPTRNALGCSPLFRESASIGYRFNANWSIMATVEHLSNAGLCDRNRGLTNLGARIGYTF